MIGYLILLECFTDLNFSLRYPPAPPLPPRSTFVDVSVQTEDILTSRNFNDGRELIELNIDMGELLNHLHFLVELIFSFDVFSNHAQQIGIIRASQ